MCGPAAVGTLERAALVLVTAIVESAGYVVPAARMRLSAMSSSMGADVLLSVEAAAVASGRAAGAIYAAVSRGQIARHWNATGRRYRVRLGEVIELRTRPRRRLSVSTEPVGP